MGQDISNKEFRQEHFDLFHQHLRQETKTLMSLFRDNKFEKITVPTVGLEVEGWLVDKDFLPLPQADIFLDNVNDDMVVPEISQFNFELNTAPLKLEKNILSQFHTQLKNRWQKCQKSAQLMGGKCLSIGSLPTLRESMLQLDYLYPNKRYFALNEQILKFRKNQKINISIQGKESIDFSIDNVMLESAATSFQIHLQIDPSRMAQFYNASLIASSFTNAVSSNSPFLFGKVLWDDTRVAIFEQAIEMNSFRQIDGSSAKRVSFGSGYLKKSMFELFLENLDGHPTLLPEICNIRDHQLCHLRLHNGTVWRWNRPIIGFNGNGVPHLRIEHRVQAAGPSFNDTIADTAFYLGLVYYFSNISDRLQKQISFTQARSNFYEACKYSFNAECYWGGGKKNLQNILVEDLLDASYNALKLLNVDKDELNYYFNDILRPRVVSGQNGAHWQRGFINTHGHRYQELLENYYENQSNDTPISQWKMH